MRLNIPLVCFVFYSVVNMVIFTITLCLFMYFFVLNVLFLFVLYPCHVRLSFERIFNKLSFKREVQLVIQNRFNPLLVSLKCNVQRNTAVVIKRSILNHAASVIYDSCFNMTSIVALRIFNNKPNPSNFFVYNKYSDSRWLTSISPYK